MLFSVDILTFDVEDEDEDVEDEVVMIDGGCRRCTPHFLEATEDIFKDLRFTVVANVVIWFPFYCFFFSICLIYDPNYFSSAL